MLDRNRIPLMNANDAPASGAQPPAPSATSPAPPAATPQLPPELAALVSNPEAFKQRLAEAGASAQSRIFKELGVKDADELKARLAEGRKLADEKLSEQERIKKQIDELTPKAQLAEARGATITKYLAAEEAAIPEDKRSLLDLAPSADRPEARLEWIAAAKAKGLFAPSAPPAPTPPAQKPANPANTIAPPGPAPTPPAGQPTPQQVYDQLMREGKEMRAAGLAQQYPSINRTAWRKQQQ